MRLICLLTAGSLIATVYGATTSSATPATAVHKKKTKHRPVHSHVAAKQSATAVAAHRPVSYLSRLPKKHYFSSLWTSPTFADSTVGDSVDGEDLIVRRAAVQALGPYNGTVVVV